jgi:hypothetical protein
MSIKHMSMIFEHLQVKPAPKLVALVLADHANAEGVCFPSYRRIADWTGMDKRTIQRHVRFLIDLGVVTKLRTGHIVKTGTKTIRVSNAYKIHLDRLIRLSTIDLGTGAQFVTPQSDKTVTSRVGGLSTKPLINPQRSNHHSGGEVDNSQDRDPKNAGDLMRDLLNSMIDEQEN